MTDQPSDIKGFFDRFDTRRFGGALHTRAVGRALRQLERCVSTNDEAAAWARAGAPHGALVIADAQTRGRGRLGRAWYSPPGENLYFSTVLRPSLAPHRAPPLTLVAAVALAEAVAAEGAAPELKWPNDLLLDGRKLAGILTEMSTAAAAIQFVVVGIGVNLNGRVFPAELSGRATSLALALGRPVDRSTFAAGLADALEAWYERFLVEGPGLVVAAWKARSRLLGREVEVTNGTETLRGVAEDLDEDGALLLRRPDGTLARVLAGELRAL